jgi:hypothetical protein
VLDYLSALRAARRRGATESPGRRASGSMVAREAERDIPFRCGFGRDAVATSRRRSRRCPAVRKLGRRRQGLRWRYLTSRSKPGAACRTRRQGRPRASVATRRLDAKRSSSSHYPRTTSDTSPTPRPVRRHRPRPCCCSRKAIAPAASVSEHQSGRPRDVGQSRDASLARASSTRRPSRPTERAWLVRTTALASISGMTPAKLRKPPVPPSCSSSLQRVRRQGRRCPGGTISQPSPISTFAGRRGGALSRPLPRPTARPTSARGCRRR